MTNSCKNVSAYDYTVPLSGCILVLVNNPKGNSRNLSNAGKCSLPLMTHSDFCGSAFFERKLDMFLVGQHFWMIIFVNDSTKPQLPNLARSSSTSPSSNFLNNGSGWFNFWPGCNSLGFHAT